MREIEKDILKERESERERERDVLKVGERKEDLYGEKERLKKNY